MYESRIVSDQTRMLMEGILTLENEEDAFRFFEDLCTIPEIKSIAQRMNVAWLLKKGETYQAIAAKTGASSATISRVNRSLIYGSGGYDRVFKKMSEEKKE